MPRVRDEAFQREAASYVIIAVSIILLKWRTDEGQRYKAACEEYIRKLQKKQQKLSYKNRFIATLTHEMRNMVTRFLLLPAHLL